MSRIRPGRTSRDVLARGTACLACSYPMDSSTGMTSNAEVPADGDVSVCLRCGALALFRATPFGLTLQSVPPDRREELAADPDIALLVATVRRLEW